MADVFVSYAREDINFAKKLAKTLATQGWSVWWDRRIAIGDRFSEVIAKQLQEARCVVTVWSRQSVGSRWVHDEAEYALEQKKLVPVLADNVDIPLGFRGVHAADLRGWRGSSQHPEFRRLIQDISERLGPARPSELDERDKNRQTLLSKKAIIIGGVSVVLLTSLLLLLITLGKGCILIDIIGCSNSSSTIRVPARPLDWSHGIFTSSNIHVEANQRVTFNASGQWYIGAGSEGIGPEGVEAPCECVVSNEKGGGRQGRLGALIGKIGEDGEPFLVGAEKTISAEKSGIIFLGSNDNMAPCPNLGNNRGSCYKDNHGDLEVKIHIK